MLNKTSNLKWGIVFLVILGVFLSQKVPSNNMQKVVQVVSIGLSAVLMFLILKNKDEKKNFKWNLITLILLVITFIAYIIVKEG